MQLESLKDLQAYYNSTNPNYLYIDKNFDIRGIDYTKFLQLKYESINNSHIQDYSPEGWYILWYLMSRATKGEYVQTTLNVISEESSLKAIKVREALFRLQESEVILVDKTLSTLTNNEMIRVYIGYNNNLCDHIIQNGYCPLPTEFVYKIITTLSPIEWAIYTVLLVRYNYFLAFETVSNGKKVPVFHRTHYAFPTRDAMAELIGVTDDTISKFTKKLAGNKYNLIHMYKSDPYSFYSQEEKKQKVRGGNNRYEVKLFERPEYAYYYLNLNFTKQEQKDFEYIKAHTFEEVALSERQHLIRGKKMLYIKYYNEDTLLLFDKCLMEKDADLYKQVRENRSIVV